MTIWAWLILIGFVAALVVVMMRGRTVPVPDQPEALETYRSPKPLPAGSTVSKRDAFEALLRRSESVLVNFDPRCDGVDVPEGLRAQPRCVLQYGRRMAVRIRDLQVGERGIAATLSFDGTGRRTFVPWTAVFALVDAKQQGWLWEDDMPSDVELTPAKKDNGP